MRASAALVAGSTAGERAIDLAGERPVAVGVRHDIGLLAGVDRGELLGRDARGEFDQVEVGHLDQRLGGGAIDLLADVHQPFDHVAGNRRGDLGARQLAIGRVERGERRLHGGLRRRLLRPGVLDLLAGRDAALEQAVGPFEVQLRVFERRPGLHDGRSRLALLILERPRVDFGDHLPGGHRVPLGDTQHHHPPRDERADAHILIRQGGNRAAHDQPGDQVLPGHLADLGDDGRHVDGRALLLGLLRAAGRPGPARPRRTG